MSDLQTPGPNGPGEPPLSPEEFRRRAQAIQDATPTAFDSLRTAADTTGAAPRPRTNPAPAKGLGARVLDNIMETRTVDAVGRGALTGVNEASNAVVGLGGWLTKNTGLYRLVNDDQGEKDFLDWYDAGRTSDINPLQVGDRTLDRMFGQKQEGLGGFIEGIGQVAVGLAATGGLAIEGQTAKLLAQGALIDGAFFDPYQTRIANMIDDTKLPIAGDLAHFMAAHPDDNEAVARLKGVLEGAMVGAAVGKALHSLNAVRIRAWAKVGKFAGGTKESAEAAIKAELASAEKAGVSGTDEVQVIAHEDGTATVMPNKSQPVAPVEPATPVEQQLATPVGGEGRVNRNVHDMRDAFEAAFQAHPSDGTRNILLGPDGEPALRVVLANKGGNVVEVKSIENLKAGARQGFAKEQLGRLVQLADEHGVDLTLHASPFGENAISRESLRDLYRKYGFEQSDHRDPSNMVRKAGAGEVSFREVPTPEKVESEGLHFDTVGEAHSFAASVNEAVANRSLPRGGVSPETLKWFRARAATLTQGKSLEEVESMFGQWGRDFNFSRSSSSTEVKTQIEALSQELPTITEMARAIGTQPHEVTQQLAMRLNRHLDAGQAIAMAKKIFGDTKELPQKLLATRAWLYAQGADVSRLSRIVDGNKDNAVAMKELANAIDQLWDFHASAAGTASNVARTLDQQRIDPTPLVESLQRREATAATAGEQAAKDASDQIDAAVEGKSAGQQTREAAKDAEKLAKDAKAPKATDAPAAESPKRAATRQAAADALEELKRVREEMDKVDRRFAKDTPLTGEGDTPNATEFSLARARRKAKAAIEAAKQEGFDVFEGAQSPHSGATAEQRSRDVLDAAHAQKDAPLVAPDGQAPKAQLNPIDELSRTLDAEEKQLESIVNPKPKVQGPREHNDPVGDFIKANSTKSPGTRLSSGMTKRELQGLARQIRMAEGDPDKILDAMFSVRAEKVAKGDPSLMQRIIGYRMNAMLSGPKTMIINATSNAMAALQRPVEYWWAGLRSGNKDLQSMGSDMLVGLGTEFGDSFRAAWKSLVAGENLLDRSKASFEDTTAELAAKGGKTWLQTTLNAPGRILMSTDEFFKQLNYRTNVRAQAIRDARELGLTAPKDIAEHVEGTLESAFALNGDRGATNPVALEYSRVSTFTNDLGDGTMGKWIQNGAINHPAIRLIMPFVRTPVNLFRWTWERTPGLARFTNTYKEAITAGGERAAIAKSKVELGSAMYSAAALYAVAGNITGAGPSNKLLRQQWLDAGNQPYSIKIPGTEKWVSYRRADPVITPLGLTATAVDNLRESGRKIASAARIRNLQRDGSDGHPVGELLGMIADFAHASGDIAQEDGTRMATSFIAAIAANVSSKTFMQGTVEFMDALAGGEPFKVENMAVNMATSFIPNVLRQTNPDDTMRETRGLLDEVINRTPFSGNLEPKRNIFGEPVLRAPGYINRAFNPFTVTSKSDDPTVADELVALGRGMTMPAEQRLEGLVNMTDRSKYAAGAAPERQGQSPYDRMLEILANPGNGVPPLKSAMTALVKSPAWQNISDGTAAQPGGEKYKLAATLMGQYQDMALARVKGEYPALAKALATEDAQRAASALLGEQGVAAVQKLFQPK